MTSKGIIKRLKQQNKAITLLAGFLLTVVTGLGDFITGYELSFAFFYLIPISLVTWIVSRRAGFSYAVLSAIVWLVADLAAGRTYTSVAIYIWNTVIRICIFWVVVSLLALLKRELDHERELARIDPLTGAVNSRYFQELLSIELERLKRYRHPFTVIYTDLDNFKSVNDRFGHGVGDRALSEIVRYSKKHLRQTDIVARIGGDEFIFLLPETDEEAARIVVEKMQRGLLQEMQAHRWPITFSIGVVTCVKVAQLGDRIISIADHLMYAAKQAGKNSVNYYVYRGEPDKNFEHDETVGTGIA